MDVVIVGAGEVGYHLADILSREGHRVSVIDSHPDKARRLSEALDVHALVGDGTRAEILNQAGATKADLVVAVSNNDQVNMLVCVIARSLGARRIVLRLKDTTRLAEYRYFYKQTLGFDVVLSTDELAADEIVATVREQHALEVESFADGRVQMRRLRIREESKLTSESIAGLQFGPGLLIVAVSRGDNFFVPGGDDRIQVDDQIYVLGRAGDLDQFEVAAGAPRLGRRSVVIMGGSDIGAAIARHLEGIPGVTIRILEKDAERARVLAQSSSAQAMVLVGDATDLDLLMEERIGSANVFIATTADDEVNLMACQLARSLGVERTVAMVNKGSYRQIYDLLGIDLAISPRILCANQILRFVRSSSVASIAVIADGRAEVLELQAHFKGGKSIRVKNLGLPRGAVIGSVIRDEEVIIPQGDTLVHDGDHVILFSLPENLETVQELLTGGSVVNR